MPRSLQVIAREIKVDWVAQGKTFPHAAPYLKAMHTLHSIDDKYYADSAKSVVLYFLANASSWRGDVARRIKVELKAMVK